MAKNKKPNNYPLSFMGKRNRQFKDSAFINSAVFNFYMSRLTDIALSVFKYTDLPQSIDVAYLETLLFSRGAAVICYDDTINDYIVLELADISKYNYAGKPLIYSGVAPFINYYRVNLDYSNSVLIYNNLMRLPSEPDLFDFARRLYEIQTTEEVNVKAQKTPVLIRATESQRLTMLNLYQQYDGNQPFIFADKSLDINDITAISTNAPFIAPQLDDLKNRIWGEALTYLGVSNLTIQKKERLLTDEVNRTQGGTIASRYSRLTARQTAIDHFNDIYGLAASVEYREDIATGLNDPAQEEVEPNE